MPSATKTAQLKLDRVTPSHCRVEPKPCAWSSPRHPGWSADELQRFDDYWNPPHLSVDLRAVPRCVAPRSGGVFADRAGVAASEP